MNFPPILNVRICIFHSAILFFLLQMHCNCSANAAESVLQIPTSQNASTSSFSPQTQVKIGFVVASEIEVKVLSLIMQDLEETVGIDSKLNLSFATELNCSNFRGVTFAAELYYRGSINTLIGPGCPDGLDCVAMMAASWNLPMISYITGNDLLMDKIKYQTLANVSPTSVKSFCNSILALLNSFGWQKIALLYNAQDADVMLRVKYIQQRFTEINVQILSIELPANSSSYGPKEYNLLQSIQQFTRVILIMNGLHLFDALPVLRALRSMEISPREYAILLPWLDRTPMHDKNSSIIHAADFADFAGTIVVDSDRDGTNVTERFTQKLNASNVITKNGSNTVFNLYDALKLYILVANSVSKQYGPEYVLNGTIMWNGMRQIQFEGASGMIFMDSNGDRLPYFNSYVIASSAGNNKNCTTTLANITPNVAQNCNSGANDPKNSPECLDFNVSIVNKTMWDILARNGQEPSCGYDGTKCSYNLFWFFVAGGMVLILAIVLSILAIVYVWRREKHRVFSRIPWLIPATEIELLNGRHKQQQNEKENEAEGEGMHHSPRFHKNVQHSSTGDLSYGIGALPADSDGTIANFGGSIMKLARFKQLKSIALHNDESTIMITQIKQLVHDNINPLVGLSCNNPNNELLFLWKYCSRGTLSDYIHNAEMRMDANFKAAFLRDIVNGLDYIHNSPMGYHGSLDPSKCVIDANFVVKIVAIGVNDLVAEWRRAGILTDFDEPIQQPANDGNQQQNNADAITMKIGEEQWNDTPLDPDDTIYRAPELLRHALPSRFRQLQMSRPDQLRFKGQGRNADVYSLAMLMYEVLFRQRIFGEVHLPDGAIIAILKSSGDRPLRPEIPKILNKEHHSNIIQIIHKCWSEMPMSRPNMRHIKKTFFSVYKISGGLVQSVIQMIDQHAHSLEKQVRERTRLLEEAQLRADRLLAQMLPKDIARDLKLGRPVIPRTFPSASILFTDIVSFTNICAASTPMEIVAFLNDLFMGYDDITGQMDAFKVETIGDAYMVVSGVPKENGTEHARQIALIALRMRQYLLNYKLPHMPDHKMEARWGIHTGSVAAGVVGLTAPRYCLFGDTVNMASRMESSGEPGRIQMSSQLHDLILSRADPFLIKERGQINVKGKGECTTFWLLDPPAAIEEMTD